MKKYFSVLIATVLLVCSASCVNNMKDNTTTDAGTVSEPDASEKDNNQITTNDLDSIESDKVVAVDVSGLSGYTVYPVSADYGEGNPFACEPAEGFHAFSGVKSDADTGVKTKTFEYNGKTVELTYDGKTDSSLGDHGPVSVYSYADPGFAERFFGRRYDEYTSTVSFYENGEICEISGALLGLPETDGARDTEALKAAVTGKYGNTFDFGAYGFCESEEHKNSKGEVNYITFRWFNKKNGVRINDGVTVSVLTDGTPMQVKMPSGNKLEELNAHLNSEEASAIIEDRISKTLADKGFTRLTVDEYYVRIYGSADIDAETAKKLAADEEKKYEGVYPTMLFDVYEGKPAFYCTDLVCYADGENNAHSVTAEFLILMTGE